MTPQLLLMIQAGFKNPKTTVLAIVALAVGGAGKYLQENAIEPLGTLLLGLAALLVLIMGWVSKLATEKEAAAAAVVVQPAAPPVTADQPPKVPPP